MESKVHLLTAQEALERSVRRVTIPPSQEAPLGRDDIALLRRVLAAASFRIHPDDDERAFALIARLGRDWTD